jgi:hypothetical protein
MATQGLGGKLPLPCLDQEQRQCAAGVDRQAGNPWIDPD